MTGVQTCALPICQYRITDYTCTTVQTDSRSEGNDFDIIVVADSNNKLNEAARAIRMAGDTYFPSDTLFEVIEFNGIILKVTTPEASTLIFRACASTTAAVPNKLV